LEKRFLQLRSFLPVGLGQFELQEAKTGEPHYALVARLLQETNVDGEMTGRRLREAYVSIKKNHFATLRWLRVATVHLEAYENEGKMVIFAYAHDQNESAERTND
jgi:hypothetical protein